MARNGLGLDYSDDNPTGPDRPNPFIVSSNIDLRAADSPVKEGAESVSVERPDGAVTIEFKDDGDQTDYQQPLGVGFDRNLADEMSDEELSNISYELLEGIEADLQSRKEWIDTRAKGIRMLALQVDEPQQGADYGPSTAPVEGQSRVRHSIMLEATVAFQAGARGELLPDAGPIKIRNVTPPAAPQGAADSSYPKDELAAALELDLNWFLTDTAREYIPDSDRMFFNVAYSGDGFKKGFHCPLRRRPVLESIDAEDLIVSNAATDLHSCGRVTHRIKMRKSVMRRMQLLGAYRDFELPAEPEVKPVDEVQKEKAEVGGYKTQPLRNKDADYEVYECYCELDLNRFAPKHLRDSGLPLPYKVTIETTTKKVLEVRRNWNKSDREAKAKLRIVQYPFIRGLGFYGLGFVHLLGNSVMALTAAYRLMLDAGMMANFPGFVGDKQAGRQLTNQMRVPPGGFVGLDVPSGRRVQDVIMSVPYKEVGPAFPAFIQHLEDRTKQLAMVANSAVGEGKQDAPVGTTLALIEQATKVEASAFKRLHDAQAEEFRILKDLFREDPQALMRHAKGKNPSGHQWQQAQFMQALESYELVPVADPNNPTSLHRAMKAAMLKMLAMQNPQAYDQVAVDRRIMMMSGIDPSGVFAQPQPQGPDPIQMAMQARQQMLQMQMALRQQEQQLKAALAIQDAQGKAADRASREKIEKMKMEMQHVQAQWDTTIERLKLNAETLRHIHELARNEKQDHEQHMAAEREYGFKQQQMDRDHGLKTQQMERDHGLKQQQFAHQRGQDQQSSLLAQHQAGHKMALDQIGQQLGFLQKNADRDMRQQQFAQSSSAKEKPASSR